MDANSLRRTPSLALLLLAGALLASAPARADELGIPTGGLDSVLLTDGRVVRCVVGEASKDGKTVLQFPSASFPVETARIETVRRFADYDPEPRNDEEKARVEKGLIRWDGRWIPKEKALAAQKKQAEEDAKQRLDDDAHGTWETRRKVETEHFVFEADIPKAQLDYYSGLMEAYYAAFTKYFKITLTQREKKQKLPVFLFRKRDDFRVYHDRDTSGKSEHLLGYFMPAIGQERLVFFDLPGNRDDTVAVMFHEATHFLIHLAEPKVLTSRWIHEGVAEYIGSSVYTGKTFRIGGTQDGRLLHFQEMIRKGKVIPMDNFMQAGNPSVEGRGIEFSGEHYAQTTMLVHFLMEGKNQKYRNAFISYFTRCLSGKGVKYTAIAGSDQKFIEYEEGKALLLRTLGLKDFEPLMKELEEYAMALPLGDATAYVTRGEISYFNRRDQEAAFADWDEAERRGVDNAKVLAELGRVYTHIGERADRVVPLLQRAVELDPLAVKYRYWLSTRLPEEESLLQLRICVEIEPTYADALSALGLRTFIALRDRDKVGEDERPRVDEALAMLAKAIATDPKAETYFAQASLYLLIGEFEKAREAAKAATEMAPEDEGYLWRLAQCYALLGSAEDFGKILRRIELLLRRGAQVRSGETAAGARQGMSPEDAAALMATLVRRMAERCLTWDKSKEALMALGAWYARRPPQNEDDWVFWTTVASMAGDDAGARKIAGDGLAACPESALLKQYAAAGSGE